MLNRLLLLLSFAAGIAQAAEFGGADPFAPQEHEPLPPHEAFVMSHFVEGDALHVRFQMPEGYYLYGHRFGFDTRPASSLTLGDAQIPPGKEKFDEFEGDVEVYYDEVEIIVPVDAPDGFGEVGVNYQGCAEMGYCYPPELKWVAFGDVPAETASSAPAAAAPALSEDQSFSALLSEGGLLLIVGAFFVAGIALAFTPCVLPMVPILSGIIVGEGASLSRRKAVLLSVAYVLGMALTYAAVGMLVGLFGAELNLQAKLQSPPVLIVFAIVFGLLSLSMFGFYELQLPSSWQNALNNLGGQQGGGKLLSVFIMGALSSLVVSPCVSAPLTGALVYISQTEDAVLGGMALLSLGLGMGVPLLLVGAGGGHLLPRAGAWMDTVKAVFGVLLLAVAIWLLERILPAPVTLALWGILLLVSGVYMGALDLQSRAGWGQLWKGLGFVGLVAGVLLLIGAASGAANPLRPLERLAGGGGGPGVVSTAEAKGGWLMVNDLAEVQSAARQAAAQGKPAMLDFYADWCISCKLMERDVFTDGEIASRFQNFVLLKVDITDNNEAHQALLNHYGLFGPPTLLFFGEEGREISELRIQGEVGVAALAARLDAVQAHIEEKNSSI